MYIKCDMACEICRTPEAELPKSLNIDHVHGTFGMHGVRGLLCNACNTALGKLGDTAEGLRRALAYLESFERRE